MPASVFVLSFVRTPVVVDRFDFEPLVGNDAVPEVVVVVVVDEFAIVVVFDVVEAVSLLFESAAVVVTSWSSISIKNNGSISICGCAAANCVAYAIACHRTRTVRIRAQKQTKTKQKKQTNKQKIDTVTLMASGARMYRKPAA